MHVELLGFRAGRCQRPMRNISLYGPEPGSVSHTRNSLRLDEDFNSKRPCYMYIDIDISKGAVTSTGMGMPICLYVPIPR